LSKAQLIKITIRSSRSLISRTRVFEEGLIVEFDSVLDRLKKMEHEKIKGHYAIDEVSEDYLVNTCAIEGGNIELLIKLVTGEYIRRNDIAAAQEKIKWAMDGNLPLDDYLEKAHYQSTENMLHYATLRGTQAESMSEGIEKLEAKLAQDRNNPESPEWVWHSGFTSLDILMGRGYLKGKTYAWAGRPGGGKSLMIQAGATAGINQEARPFILSLEMSAEAFWQRMLVAECGIELDRIHSGNMDKQEQARLAESILRLKKHKMGKQFRIEYKPRPSLVEMRMLLAQQISEWGANQFFLDYASFRKIKPVNENTPPNIQQGLISQWLVEVAKEFQIPVITAAQTTRESEKRGTEPQLGDLENSVAMEQDLDFIGIFQADSTQPAGAGYTVVNCHVVKARFGQVGVAPLKFYKNLSTIREM
jgi:replicative DNA helicase